MSGAEGGGVDVGMAPNQVRLSTAKQAPAVSVPPGMSPEEPPASNLSCTGDQRLKKTNKKKNKTKKKLPSNCIKVLSKSKWWTGL